MSAWSFYSLFIVLYSFSFAFPQEAWWRFIIVTPPALLLIWLYKKNDFQAFAGFSKVDAKDILLALALLIISSMASFYVIPEFLLDKGILTLNPEPGLLRLLDSPPHVLLEEILFRAILLRVIILKIPKPLTVTIAGAILFSLAHWFNYGPIRGEAFLTLSCLTSLFFVGLSLNLIYLRSNSILIPFAIHEGWNFFRFTPQWKYIDTDILLTQGQSFNAIEGDPITLGFSVFILVIGIAYYKYRPTNSESVFHGVQ